MRTRRTIYYFLFLAIITGAFASMAQNNYGLKIISWSCLLFALTFMSEFLIRYRKLSILKRIEHVAISIFIALFGLRAAYIHFHYVELIVVGTSIVLAIIYFSILLKTFREIKSGNSFLSRVMIFHYLTVVAFLISVSLRPLTPFGSQAMGGIGGLCLGLVFLSVIFRNKQMLEGEETKILDYIRNQDNHSSWFVTGFLMISIYVGLNFVGVLPTLYTDEVPQAYIELVNEAETGRAKALDGRFQHDLYKEELDKFLERHKVDN